MQQAFDEGFAEAFKLSKSIAANRAKIAISMALRQEGKLKEGQAETEAEMKTATEKLKKLCELSESVVDKADWTKKVEGL